MGFWDGKKVLVAGGAGFMGSHVAEELLKSGTKTQVTVADNFSRSKTANMAGIADRVRVEPADVASTEDCRRLCRGQDVVLNLAGRAGGVASHVARPASMFRDNLRRATHMLEAAQDAGVERYLVVSSACVYPKDAPVPTPESEGFSSWPDPANEGYGWAKRMMEFEAMAAHKEFGLRVAVARPYNCYGPRDHFEPEESRVIPALIRRVLEGENPVQVWGDGSQTRSFLYVEDAAQGLLDITERYAECDPVNIGSEDEVSIKDLVAMILELCKSKARVRFDPTKPAGPARRNCDTSKARAKVGFKSRIGLREGLERTIKWYSTARRKGIL